MIRCWEAEVSSGRAVWSLLLGFALMGLSTGCWIPESYTRAKQVRTVADLQVISHRLNDARQESSGLSLQGARAIVDSVNDGEDGWGNEILIDLRGSGEDQSYLLVSFGRDGVPDFVSTDAYWTLDEVDIRGEGDRDVVVRDGRFVTLAGK